MLNLFLTKKFNEMVEIKKVIEAFELALSAYEEAVSKRKISYYKLTDMGLTYGICYFLATKDETVNISNIIFKKNGYYKNYLKYSGFLHDIPSSIQYYRCIYSYVKTTAYNESLKFRRDFLRTEITELKKLIKNGYTHI